MSFFPNSSKVSQICGLILSGETKTENSPCSKVSANIVTNSTTGKNLDKQQFCTESQFSDVKYDWTRMCGQDCCKKLCSFTSSCVGQDFSALV